MGLFSNIKREALLRREAAELYSQLVAQARDPWFYTEAGVPDTLDGRFEMIVLMLARSLFDVGATAPNPHLLEIFIDDMDRSLREMGVGDMGVARRIKQMGAALNGRLKAYESAMDNADTLRTVLQRNVYATAPDATAEQQEKLLQRMIAHE